MGTYLESSKPAELDIPNQIFHPLVQFPFSTPPSNFIVLRLNEFGRFRTLFTQFDDCLQLQDPSVKREDIFLLAFPLTLSIER